MKMRLVLFCAMSGGGVQRHGTDVDAGEIARQPDNSWKVCPQTRAAKVATMDDTMK